MTSTCEKPRAARFSSKLFATAASVDSRVPWTPSLNKSAASNVPVVQVALE
eukprot:CAMPEP_0117510436 /NCGR_PEP_ID=MMETSP0784-20121206/27990_1 /TAXON_ID=39447 /ORGANISM="" /LENGTH=50 /DNA_ID=CAMNT_0005306075 /DNA_START=216 /DNA_END=368 /DNA_ORIENTATION=+